MEIKGKFTMDLKEYKEFCKFHRKKTNIIFLFLFFLILAMLINFEYKAYGNITIVVIGFAIAIPIVLGIDKVSFHFVCKRMYDSAPLSRLEVENVINEEGFTQTSEAGVTKITFSQFYKIYETKNAFYLYISKMQAIIMMKKYFEKEEDIRTLKEILISKMDKKKLIFMK